ncbi:MAG: Arm DNA-binding domain-containing protein [Pseudomonadota bacterium]
MALSDAAIRAAKPRAKAFKLFDEGGLFVLVSPSGGKLWRLKYRHLGKKQLLSLGRYSDVGLKDARDRRDQARKLIASGANPAFEKKRAAIAASVGAANTFKAVADEFIDKRAREDLKEITTGKAKWLLAQLEPALGSRPIAEIEPYELLAVCVPLSWPPSTGPSPDHPSHYPSVRSSGLTRTQGCGALPNG